MVGKARIREFVESVAAMELDLKVSHTVVGPTRAAYRLTVRFPDSRRIIEHIIIELSGGRIVAEVDVEAWD